MPNSQVAKATNLIMQFEVQNHLDSVRAEVNVSCLMLCPYLDPRHKHTSYIMSHVHVPDLKISVRCALQATVFDLQDILRCVLSKTSKFTLNTRMSKLHLMCITRVPESKILFRFALRSAFLLDINLLKFAYGPNDLRMILNI